MKKVDLDNHANQMNSNNDAYKKSRAHEGAPNDGGKVLEKKMDDVKIPAPSHSAPKK